MKTTLIISLYEEEDTVVSEKNYKEILTVLTYNITVSENDNDILDKHMETLAENWYETEPKNKEAWNAMEKEWDKYKEQIEDNKAVIKSCEDTIELIEKFAEVEGWE